MPTNAHYLLLLTLFCTPSTLLASVIQRCEAADGRITFTSLGCNAGERISQQDVRPSPPSKSVALLPEAEWRETPNRKNRGRIEDDRMQRFSEGTYEQKAKSRTAKSPQ